MRISVLVTNKPPQTDQKVPEPLLTLFRRYVSNDDQSYIPYSHQAQTFRAVTDDKEVFLVAGTAAGKTLAIAVPLFAKLQARRIRKVLLMYPTIALMEDQSKVMRKLAEITGLEVGHIQGGMPRSKLIAALNKPVILATPDAVYWFFRKNVKYNGLLIYALAMVDEYVLDEAHLFNGLMLRNFEHLWQRIKSLAAPLGRLPRLHILTATPTEPLQRLNAGKIITGQSKCQDVMVELLPCARFDRSDVMVTEVNEALAAGRRKILLVCNSARMAHQLFERHRNKVTMTLPAAHQLQFGKVLMDELLDWLEQSGVEPEIVEQLSTRFLSEENVTLSDLPVGAQVNLPFAEVIGVTSEVLERVGWQVKRALWEHIQKPEETWESLLHNRRLPCAVVAALQKQLVSAPDHEQQKALVDLWVTDALETLDVMESETIACQAPDFVDLQQILATGLDETVSALVVRRLVHEIKVNPEWTNAKPHNLGNRPIYLRWLDWMVERNQAQNIREIVRTGLESGSLRSDCRHIGLWKGTNVPVIVYSGSMAKGARTGLINAFADLEQAVLISTSAVEVGVDFAADTLITEECESNGFLQRFGRVGRHGDQGRAVVLISGDLFSRWRELDGHALSRHDFSARIQDTFPYHNYAAASRLVDASHFLVNEQLGRIGTRLNLAPDLATARDLARQLRDAEIPIGFGLRSTLPQITLKDGVTKDPFYLLRYLGDKDLRPAESPFEMARAKIWFTELLFQKASYTVAVDLNATLQASRVWFRIVKGEVGIAQVKPGIGSIYASRLSAYFEQNNSWHSLLPGNFIWLHGDVYLQRAEKELVYPKLEPVRDDESNPLFIPAQNYLVFLGWGDIEKAKTLLSDSPIADWEELYYDWDGVEWNRSLVILEQTAGACCAAFKEWMDYVTR
jgi:DEAD/DEAH box helicase domain-containing protein